ncbi:dipeptidyl aminopeptidase/acylaminoacyl peptidase [Parabacteroides sp. PFB2-10]|uniref:alpha/beta hydrolase family protein n=1 Tax=Parabacteroides sp. PFB2-10 TaxID=1742405 RepID=UPI002474A47F|nr:prolyl oligopeptidase family serine peptidase [Parabacteroides sp. PFB2-10]MDH6312640.1 dipeptidyl aminopeptidase/acylaminoacyl peptidase [Parabacteroides sp. PFB2-10]
MNTKSTFVYVAAGLLSLLTLNQTVAQEAVYQRPPAVIEEVVMAPLSPANRISKNNQWILQLERSYYTSLGRLAQPELKLAGMRINPVTFNVSRGSEYTDPSLLHIPTQRRVTVTGLPDGATIVGSSFSPSDTRVLLFVEEAAGIYLYSFTTEEPQAVRLSDRRLNATTGVTVQWLDDEQFLTLLVPTSATNPPAAPAVPVGPIIQETSGGREAVRTYQDLLKNPYDEALFDYYFTAQLAHWTGTAMKEIGRPAIYATMQLSPDKNLLLYAVVERPYSYQLTMGSFPRRTAVMNLDGKDVKELARTPLLNLPTGYDMTSPYPRSFSWRPDKPATIYWVEAQDGGNPRINKVDFMDIVYQSAAPFDQPKQEVARTVKRFRGILWHDDQFALMHETSRAENRTWMYRIKPASGEKPQLITELALNDRYNDPGSPVMVRNQYGRYILYTNKAKNELLMTSEGASSEGDMPLLSRFNLKDKKNTILWRSEAPYYETILEVTDPAKLTLITSRQSNTEPANLFLRDVKRKRTTQITHFAHPYPAMEGVSQEKIFYKRADGIDMSATVYLPAGYNKEKDGRLPVLMWAYPREYRSAEEAGQIRGSQYTFTSINYGSPVFWALRGYCVMAEVEMPIVGTSEEKEPNDNFLEQLRLNAEAAVKVITDRGVGDPDRVAVGGHSYGAFMTANLLAHTDLFKAGIARSGAYNRTLTPFGFQAETRTYWEAPEVYHTMSPFTYANQLKGAILLIHGEMDNNSGTFPIQSERYYQALKGHGATARYVVLPYESHGYSAKENVLHMLYETDAWLEKYVKNASK